MAKCILKCETVARGAWEMSLSPKRCQTDERLMNNYDFLILSPSEFERLTRDLLQKHLGCHIESFTQGRDGGVDLRYAGIKGKHASKRETNTNPTDNTNLQVSETYPCNPCNPCSIPLTHHGIKILNSQFLIELRSCSSNLRITQNNEYNDANRNISSCK